MELSEEVTRIVDTILYGDVTEEILAQIRETDNAELLHTIAEDYNYDDGLEIPEIIVNNPFCELATALTIFCDAGGYDYLDEEGREGLKRSDKDVYGFLDSLHGRIRNNEFQVGDLTFDPQLTKVQIYKFKKYADEKDWIFVEGI